MKYHIDATGGLVFTLDETECAKWRQMQDEAEHGYDIIDVFTQSDLDGNFALDYVHPQKSGALIGAPFFTDKKEYGPGGIMVGLGNVWRFPYPAGDPLDVLIENGSVRFAPDPKNSKSEQAA